MKLRIVVFLIAVGLVGLGIWSMRRGPRPATAPATRPAPAQVAEPTNPPTAAAPAEVAIQDGKTIDFSSGKPVVKGDAEQKAVIDSSVKQMNAVAEGVTFGPAPTATTTTAPAAPTPAPTPTN